MWEQGIQDGKAPEASTEGRRKPVSAIIMAGGYGTRLKHLTKAIPKPMVPVAGRPVLEHIVDHLEDHGIDEAAMALHYLPQVITGHFGERRGKMRFKYSISPDDYGTAGAVRRASQHTSDNPLLVLSGDVLSSFNLSRLMDFHFEKRSLFTMGLVKVNDPSQYGVVHTDDAHRIVGFVEKPKDYPEKTCWVNAGIYVIDRSLLSHIPDQEFFDISRHFIPKLMANGIDLHGSKLDGHWFDVGTPQTLAAAAEFYGAKSESRNREARASISGSLAHAACF